MTRHLASWPGAFGSLLANETERGTGHAFGSAYIDRGAAPRRSSMSVGLKMPIVGHVADQCA